MLQCGLLRMSGFVGRQLSIGSLIHVQSNVVLAELALYSMLGRMIEIDVEGCQRFVQGTAMHL